MKKKYVPFFSMLLLYILTFQGLIVNLPTASAQNSSLTLQEIRSAMETLYMTGAPDFNKYGQPTLEVISTTKETDHERWHIKYLVDEDEYAYAYLLKPLKLKNGEKYPIVLCPHPTTDNGKDRVAGIYPGLAQSVSEQRSRDNRQYALELVRLGFITFAPDRAGYGERQLEENGTFTSQMDAFQRYLNKKRPGFTLTGKNVYDLKIGLNVLQTLDFIDMDNIGIIGHSLGAHDALMLAAFDSRVKAAVVNSGSPIRFEPRWWDLKSQDLQSYIRSGPIKSGMFDKHANFFVMMVAPRNLLYQYSIADGYSWNPSVVEAPRIIDSLYSAVQGTKKTNFNIYLHGKGHDFTPESRALSYKWLEECLMTNDKSTNTAELFIPQPIDITSGYTQHFTRLGSAFPSGWTAYFVAQNEQNGLEPEQNPRTGEGVKKAPNLVNGTAASKGNFVYNYGGQLGFKNGKYSDYALAVALNTKSIKGNKQIQIKFDAMVMRNLYDGKENNLINSLNLQYRIGKTGPFINLGETIKNGTNKLATGIKATAKEPFTFVLPKECNGQEIVYLRWIAQYVSGDLIHSDIRPSFAIDNFQIESTHTR